MISPLPRLLHLWPKRLSFPLSAFSSSPRLCRPSSDEESAEQLRADIASRVAAWKQKSLRNSSELKRAQHSIWQLQMEAKRLKLDAQTGTPVAIAAPVQATLEVLSNGTGQMHSCVFIRTALRVYLFDCPEGISRFVNSFRIKPSMIRDIFITSATWDCMGGVASVMLAKAENHDAIEVVRLHGTTQLKRYLECVRPFADSDTDRVARHTRLDERGHDRGTYDDGAILVDYIPLGVTSRVVMDPFASGGEEKGDRTGPVLAYLVKLKPPPQRIDPLKLLEFGVPAGPLVGQLKRGEKITLPSGKVVLPENVLASESELDERATLILRCDDPHLIPSLVASSLLTPYYSKTARLRYVVHLTRDEVFTSSAYRAWMQSLGDDVQHVVVNGTGPVAPLSMDIIRHQNLLSRLHARVFPRLLAADYDSTGKEDEKMAGEVIVARPNQRFVLRGSANHDVLVDDTGETRGECERSESAEFNTQLAVFKQVCDTVSTKEIYPRVTLLGTGSATFTKLRNVSATLLEVHSHSAMLIDCGEGTWGQLRVLFPDRLEELIRDLHMILITHAHQDHCFGIYTIIQQRRRVFQQAGLPYRPLLLVCNRNVISSFNTYSSLFNDMRGDVNIVNLTQADRNWHAKTEADPMAERTKVVLGPVFDVLNAIPEEYRKALGLRQVLSVRVHHTRLASGFVLVDSHGHKLVFSGDTMPCDQLIEQGKDAHLLVHEATFGDGLEKDAFRKKHSTMGQAVGVARRMNARHVILTHFSARYAKVPPLPAYLDETGNVGIAMDNMVVAWGDLSVLPHLIPLYRILYNETLFEHEMRLQSRVLREKRGEEREKEVIASIR